MRQIVTPPTQLQLNVGFDMKMTLHQLPNRNSTSAISEMLLTRFWPNFKCRPSTSGLPLWISKRIGNNKITTNKKKRQQQQLFFPNFFDVNCRSMRNIVSGGEKTSNPRARKKKLQQCFFLYEVKRISYHSFWMKLLTK